ncbi:hypothetical protein H5410_012608 [Solanum commersonii]|uniref:Uncharacterized protein n=1 Tax=Solanum commersonii TaxID=4109 RepID=A0A9J6AS68_SOLCO|nr:hypothetical protein H5410_012608 [Solanum commersonii]
MELGQPQCWKVLCNIKQEVDNNIILIIGRRDLDFWYDNWTNFHNQPDVDTKDKIRELHTVLHNNIRDKVIWIFNTNRNFTIKFFWSDCRQRSSSNNFI